MSVPAKRKSSSKARHGRSHQALGKITLNKCPKCGQAIEPHKACSFCGSYKGREVIRIKTEIKKRKK